MTESEFEQHILPCYRKMYSTAFVILSDSSEASDVVQEAFTRMWEKRKELGEMKNPEGYCVTVVRRLCIDRLRRLSVHRSTPLEDVELEVASTATSYEDSDSLQMLFSLLNQLPENQREVIKLSSLSGMDNSQIAEATGLSNVNVRALLSRGRRRLRQLFERNQ